MTDVRVGATEVSPLTLDGAVGASAPSHAWESITSSSHRTSTTS